MHLTSNSNHNVYTILKNRHCSEQKGPDVIITPGVSCPLLINKFKTVKKIFPRELSYLKSSTVSDPGEKVTWVATRVRTMGISAPVLRRRNNVDEVEIIRGADSGGRRKNPTILIKTMVFDRSMEWKKWKTGAHIYES